MMTKGGPMPQRSIVVTSDITSSALNSIHSTTTQSSTYLSSAHGNQSLVSQEQDGVSGHLDDGRDGVSGHLDDGRDGVSGRLDDGRDGVSGHLDDGQTESDAQQITCLNSLKHVDMSNGMNNVRSGGKHSMSCSSDKTTDDSFHSASLYMGGDVELSSPEVQGVRNGTDAFLPQMKEDQEEDMDFLPDSRSVSAFLSGLSSGSSPLKDQPNSPPGGHHTNPLDEHLTNCVSQPLVDDHHGDDHHGENHHGDDHHGDGHHGDGHHRENHHGDGHHRENHHGDGHHGDNHHGDDHHRDDHHGENHHGDTLVTASSGSISAARGACDVPKPRKPKLSYSRKNVVSRLITSMVEQVTISIRDNTPLEPPPAKRKPRAADSNRARRRPVKHPQGSNDNSVAEPNIIVPFGWQRLVENDVVTYLSPSLVKLVSLDAVRSYLLTEGVCKCGLPCPFIIHQLFSFDPSIVSLPWSCDQLLNSGPAEGCVHHRELIPLAAAVTANTSPTPRRRKVPKKPKPRQENPYKGMRVSELLAQRDKLNEALEERGVTPPTVTPDPAKAPPTSLPPGPGGQQQLLSTAHPTLQTSAPHPSFQSHPSPHPSPLRHSSPLSRSLKSPTRPSMAMHPVHPPHPYYRFPGDQPHPYHFHPGHPQHVMMHRPHDPQYVHYDPPPPPYHHGNPAVPHASLPPHAVDGVPGPHPVPGPQHTGPGPVYHHPPHPVPNYMYRAPGVHQGQPVPYHFTVPADSPHPMMAGSPNHRPRMVYVGPHPPAAGPPGAFPPGQGPPWAQPIYYHGPPMQHLPMSSPSGSSPALMSPRTLVSPRSMVSPHGKVHPFKGGLPSSPARLLSPPASGLLSPPASGMIPQQPGVNPGLNSMGQQRLQSPIVQNEAIPSNPNASAVKPDSNAVGGGAVQGGEDTVVREKGATLDANAGSSPAPSGSGDGSANQEAVGSANQEPVGSANQEAVGSLSKPSEESTLSLDKDSNTAGQDEQAPVKKAAQEEQAPVKNAAQEEQAPVKDVASALSDLDSNKIRLTPLAESAAMQSAPGRVLQAPARSHFTASQMLRVAAASVDPEGAKAGSFLSVSTSSEKAPVSVTVTSLAPSGIVSPCVQAKTRSPPGQKNPLSDQIPPPSGGDNPTKCLENMIENLVTPGAVGHHSNHAPLGTSTASTKAPAGTMGPLVVSTSQHSAAGESSRMSTHMQPSRVPPQHLQYHSQHSQYPMQGSLTMVRNVDPSHMNVPRYGEPNRAPVVHYIDPNFHGVMPPGHGVMPPGHHGVIPHRLASPGHHGPIYRHMTPGGPPMWAGGGPGNYLPYGPPGSYPPYGPLHQYVPVRSHGPPNQGPHTQAPPTHALPTQGPPMAGAYPMERQHVTAPPAYPYQGPPSYYQSHHQPTPAPNHPTPVANHPTVPPPFPDHHQPSIDHNSHLSDGVQNQTMQSQTAGNITSVTHAPGNTASTTLPAEDTASATHIEPATHGTEKVV